MIGTLFYFILNMSIASCAVIAALLMVRLMARIPRRIIYPLWLIAFARLVIPFAPQTRWSLFNLAGGLIKRLVTARIPVPADAGLAAMNFVGAAERYAPVEYRTESLRRIFTAGSVVWVIIAAAALLAAAFVYLLTRAELSKSVRIRDNIYRSDMLLSPVLVGVLHARIILPPALDPDSAEGRMVLRHEDVHRRRLDNLWRVAAVIIACVHWFNPLVWIMLGAFFADMERSCDEAVVRKSGADERRAYATALLRFAGERRVLLAAAFGRSGVRVRIENVLSYRKLSMVGAIATAVFIAAVALALVTNPQLGR